MTENICIYDKEPILDSNGFCITQERSNRMFEFIDICHDKSQINETYMTLHEELYKFIEREWANKSRMPLSKGSSELFAHVVLSKGKESFEMFITDPFSEEWGKKYLGKCRGIYDYGIQKWDDKEVVFPSYCPITMPL